MDVTAAEIATFLDGKVVGDDAVAITGISGLTEAGPGDIAFLANPKYAPYLQETAAAAVLVSEAQEARSGLVQIVVSNPDWAFARVVMEYGPQARPIPPGVHPTAIIGDGVELAEGVAIGPYVVVGDGARLGPGVVLHPQVVVGSDARIGEESVCYPHTTVRERCVIGKRVIIHSGAVIGSDGFGYATVAGVHHKIPQVGIVVIGDDVEIGANTTIDRARFGVTRIGDGTKVDNLVQLAHNVDIGRHCFVVAQVGVAGSTKVGNHVTLAGQSGIGGHLSIGDGAIVAARSGVSKNIAAAKVVQGQPAHDLKQHQRQQIAARRLPQMQQQVKQLAQRVAELERQLLDAASDGSAEL